MESELKMGKVRHKEQFKNQKGSSIKFFDLFLKCFHRFFKFMESENVNRLGGARYW
jgi:hypothetical protein